MALRVFVMLAIVFVGCSVPQVLGIGGEGWLGFGGCEFPGCLFETL